MKAKVSDIENSCEESSSYLEELRESQGRKSQFSRKLDYLGDLLRRRGLPDAPLQIFQVNEPSGLLYVEFPKNDLEVHVKAFDDMRTAFAEGRGWRDLDYEYFLSDEYRNTYQNEPRALLLFELAYRALFSRFLSQVFDEDRSLRNELARRSASELRTLLKRVREEVIALGGDVSIAGLLDKPPIAGLPLSGIVLEDLQPELSELSLTPRLLRVIHRAFCSDQSDAVLEKVLESVEKVPLLRVADLKGPLLNQIERLSDRELTLLLRVIFDKARRAEVCLLRELRGLDRAARRVRGKTRKDIGEKTGTLNSAMGRALGAEEKLDGLSFQVSELVTQIHRSFGSNVFHLRDYHRKRIELHRKIDDIRALRALNVRGLKELFHQWEEAPSELERLLTDFHSSRQQGREKSLEKRLSISLEQEERELLKELRKGEKGVEGSLEKLGGLKKERRLSTEKALDSYRKFFKNLAEPLIISNMMEGLVSIWPSPIADNSPHSSTHLRDNATFVSTELIPKGRLYRFSIRGKVTPTFSHRKEMERLGDITRKKLIKTASILVYDIRGFTFMSSKLHNSDREKMIINKFNSVMARVARENGGFLLKNTGDGGILWFGANSRVIYEGTYKETVTGKGLRVRHSITPGPELGIRPSEESGRRAVLCACSMVRAAEQFIRENYILYRDWFKDTEVMELLHEGVTYALLPPEFRTLFRIGVGIASGEPGIGLSYGLNAFGDPDLVGIVVNQAETLSRGKDPSQSLIFVDGETIYNFLLNVGKFELGGEARERQEDEDPLLSLVAQNVELRKKRRTYNFKELGFSATWAGYLVLEETDKSKAVQFTTKEESLEVDEEFGLLLKDGERAKAIYQINPVMETE